MILKQTRVMTLIMGCITDISTLSIKTAELCGDAIWFDWKEDEVVIQGYISGEGETGWISMPGHHFETPVVMKACMTMLRVLPNCTTAIERNPEPFDTTTCGEVQKFEADTTMNWSTKFCLDDTLPF